MANEFIARKGFIALESSQITGSLNVSGGITGSLLGTSSWANNALTASIVSTLKAGSGSASSFGGTPRTASISFNTSFSSNAYSVVVTAEDARAWTIESKTTTGFVINSNSSVGLVNSVYWIATGFSNS